MKKLLAVALLAAMILALCAPALADVYKDAGFIKKIPMKPKYTEETEHKGTVEKITYTCHQYVKDEGDEEFVLEKDMYVYLPYGYSEDQEYNVLILMHGGGEDERYWLSEERMGKPTCAVLDNMMEKGEMEPTIVVAPTSNRGREPGAEAVPRQFSDSNPAAQGENPAENEAPAAPQPEWKTPFWMEVRYDILPLIETRYATFAHGDVSEENLKATRDHRGIAGFSMGSGTTRSVMQHCLDIFSNIGNYSGGSDSQDFFDAMASEEFKDLPIKFWYHGEGSEDFALEGHLKFCAAILEKMSDRVVDGENYAYVEFKGGTHAYNCWLPHMYNCLRVFFK